jgi:hypothetical protein
LHWIEGPARFIKSFTKVHRTEVVNLVGCRMRISKLEPDPDDSEKTDKLTSLEGKAEPDPDDSIGGRGEQSSHSFDQRNFGQNHWSEPDPDEEGEADRMVVVIAEGYGTADHTDLTEPLFQV